MKIKNFPNSLISLAFGLVKYACRLCRQMDHSASPWECAHVLSPVSCPTWLLQVMAGIRVGGSNVTLLPVVIGHVT